MGAAVSKRRAKRAAKREARASSSSSSAAAASSTAAKNGAGGASGAGAGGGASGKQECTACQRSLAALDHAQLTCGHRLCDQCAATCVDDVVSKAAASSSSAPLATLVCPTCLRTTPLEASPFARSVLKLATGATYSFPASAASSAGGGGGGGGGGNSGAGLTIKKVVIEGSDDPRAAFGRGGGGGDDGDGGGDGGDGELDDGKVPITGEFNCGKHGTYRLRKLLGKGGFGEVYTAENVRSGVVDAIKLEDSSAPRHQLKKEWKLYTELGANVNSNYTGIPRVYWFGRVEQYRCMLMQGLGMSLQGKFKVDNKIWSIETISRLAIQMINVLEFVHEKHIVHRDLKPGNILLDKQNKRLFLIDYGLSTYYADVVTGEHIAQLEQPREPAKEGALVGTATFCSVRAHEHVRLSRRDDIEEMSYLLAYFVRGNLPWQVSKTIEKPRRNKMIYASKKATNADQLFRGHPSQLRKLCAYSREMAYEAKPNYDQMRAWMRELLIERDADPDVLDPWSDAKLSDKDKRRSRKQ